MVESGYQMSSDHQLKSGDRIQVVTGCRVGVVTLYASALDKREGKMIDGMAELNQEDLTILIADLQRYVMP
jgi:hypothetical protein